jgi:acyl dehydratase
VNYDEIEIGFKIPPMEVEITPVMMVMYCAITWDFARLHYDYSFAEKFGLERPVVDPQMHGSLISRMISQWLSDAGRIRKLSLRYRFPCYVGERIIYMGEVIKKYTEADLKYIECDLMAIKERGEKPVEGRGKILFY